MCVCVRVCVCVCACVYKHSGTWEFSKLEDRYVFVHVCVYVCGCVCESSRPSGAHPIVPMPPCTHKLIQTHAHARAHTHPGTCGQTPRRSKKPVPATLSRSTTRAPSTSPLPPLCDGMAVGLVSSDALCHALHNASHGRVRASLRWTAALMQAASGVCGPCPFGLAELAFLIEF